MTSSTNSQRALEPRVSALESSLESLTKNVERIANTVEKSHQELSASIQYTHQETTKEIKNWADKFIDSQKPNWSNWISGGCLLIALVAAILAPVWMTFNSHYTLIKENTFKLEELDAARINLAYDRGVKDERIRSLENQVEKINERKNSELLRGKEYNKGSRHTSVPRPQVH